MKMIGCDWNVHWQCKSFNIVTPDYRVLEAGWKRRYNREQGMEYRCPEHAEHGMEPEPALVIDLGALKAA